MLVALVPMLVLVDLAAGGTGFGVCPDGIENCPRPYSSGAEMIIILTTVLFAVIFGIRILMKMARRVQTASAREPVAAIEAESSLPDE